MFRSCQFIEVELPFLLPFTLCSLDFELFWVSTSLWMILAFLKIWISITDLVNIFSLIIISLPIAYNYLGLSISLGGIFLHGCCSVDIDLYVLVSVQACVSGAPGWFGKAVCLQTRRHLLFSLLQLLLASYNLAVFPPPYSTSVWLDGYIARISFSFWKIDLFSFYQDY